MGGTSTDVALSEHGQPTIERQTEVPYGWGLPGEVIPITVPSVNVRSVGAGGGSIAHVPQVTGALRVGPQSAGAEPGPACYAKGGTEPTVTDANVIVGHLPPRLLGGEMELDVEAAKTAVQKIGDALGLDVHQAAEGILDIVNELGSEAKAWLEREGIAASAQRVSFNVDMRYYRQGYEIPVEIDPALLAGNGTTMLAKRFNQLHEQFYRFKMEGTTCEIVNLRAIGYGDVPKPRLVESDESGGADSSHAVVDEHEVYFGGEWLPTRIFDRSRLVPGNRVDG